MAADELWSDDYCPKCGARMRWYDQWKNLLLCEECGYDFDPWAFDDEEFGDDDSEEGIPEGCAACGGPWPECMDYCRVFS